MGISHYELCYLERLLVAVKQHLEGCRVIGSLLLQPFFPSSSDNSNIWISLWNIVKGKISVTDKKEEAKEEGREVNRNMHI